MSDVDISNYSIVDLGCGRNKHSGALGVDIVDTPEADIVEDLDSFPWSLPDRSFTEIYCKDIIEHVSNPLEFLEEVYRIGKNGANVYIRTPHFTNNNAWVDPTHVRPFSAFTFQDYITSSGKYTYYSDANFSLENLTIQFPLKGLPWNRIGRFIANKSPWYYEKTVLRSIFPASSMEIELRIIK